MKYSRGQRLLLSPDWTFIPDQWQVQMWARLLEKIPQENLIYFSPTMSASDYQVLPCLDGNSYLPMEKRYHGDLATISKVVEAAVAEEVNRIRVTEKKRRPSPV